MSDSVRAKPRRDVVGCTVFGPLSLSTPISEGRQEMPQPPAILMTLHLRRSDVVTHALELLRSISVPVRSLLDDIFFGSGPDFAVQRILIDSPMQVICTFVLFIDPGAEPEATAEWENN